MVTLDAWEGFQCDISKQMNPFMMGIHSFAMTWATVGGALSPRGPPPHPLSSYTMVSLDGGRCCCCHTCFFLLYEHHRILSSKKISKSLRKVYMWDGIS